MIQSILHRQAQDTQLNESSLTELLKQPKPIAKIETAIAACTGEWAISQDLARLLANIVTTLNTQNILEFGAGSSSKIFARSLSILGGGKLTSLEQNPQWCESVWAEVNAMESVDSQMIQVVPRFTFSVTGFHFAFTQQRTHIQARGPFDCVLVDSPQYFFGREGAMPLIYEHLVENAVILVDDIGRHEEQEIVYRWLKSFPGLQLAYFNPTFGGKGLAILQFIKFEKPKVSSLGLLSNLRHLIYLFLQYPDFWSHRSRAWTGSSHR